MQSLKGYTAKANRLRAQRERSGTISYDHADSERERMATNYIVYVLNNPVKAGFPGQNTEIVAVELLPTGIFTY